MPLVTAVRPEDVVLTSGQHDLIQYSLVIAGLALFAHFVRTWNSTSEIGARYRTAALASLSITGVAFLAYVYLVLKFDSGYVRDGSGMYRPTADAFKTIAPRYMDWSVTVPLLMVEFLAVCSAVGAKARSTRFVAMAAAFLMIATGYLGAFVLDDGTSSTQLLVWGIISSVFYVVLYGVVLRALRESRGSMGGEAHTSLRNAAILLLSVWGVYPLAYAIHNWAHGSSWTTTMQVAFSLADIAAKVGFGALIHKVAKLRTAEDVNAGEETHPEEVWISSVKHSSGVQPVIADGTAADHRERARAGSSRGASAPRRR